MSLLAGAPVADQSAPPSAGTPANGLQDQRWQPAAATLSKRVAELGGPETFTPDKLVSYSRLIPSPCGQLRWLLGQIKNVHPDPVVEAGNATSATDLPTLITKRIGTSSTPVDHFGGCRVEDLAELRAWAARVAVEGIEANGERYATIVVTLVGPGGEPLAGHRLQVSEANDLRVTQEPDRTGPDGVMTITVRSSRPEEQTVTLRLTDVAGEADRVAIAWQPRATLRGPPPEPQTPDAHKSTVQAAAKTVSVGEETTVTVTLLDRNGQAVAGWFVGLRCDDCPDGKPFERQVSGPSNEDGQLKFKIRYQVAGKWTFVASFYAPHGSPSSAGDIAERASITFKPGPPEPQECSVQVPEDPVVADGQPAAVRVLLRDRFKNEVPNQRVKLVLGPLGLREVKVSPDAGETDTDAQGVAHFEISTTRAQTVTCDAECTEPSFKIPGKNVQFVPGAPDPDISTVKPESQTARVRERAPVIVTLMDKHENLVPDRTVSLTPDCDQRDKVTVEPSTPPSRGIGVHEWDVSSTIKQKVALEVKVQLTPDAEAVVLNHKAEVLFDGTKNELAIALRGRCEQRISDLLPADAPAEQNELFGLIQLAKTAGVLTDQEITDGGVMPLADQAANDRASPSKLLETAREKGWVISLDRFTTNLSAEKPMLLSTEDPTLFVELIDRGSLEGDPEQRFCGVAVCPKEINPPPRAAPFAYETRCVSAPNYRGVVDKAVAESHPGGRDMRFLIALDGLPDAAKFEAADKLLWGEDPPGDTQGLAGQKRAGSSGWVIYLPSAAVFASGGHWTSAQVCGLWGLSDYVNSSLSLGALRSEPPFKSSGSFVRIICAVLIDDSDAWGNVRRRGTLDTLLDDKRGKNNDGNMKARLWPAILICVDADKANKD